VAIVKLIIMWFETESELEEIIVSILSIREDERDMMTLRV